MSTVSMFSISSSSQSKISSLATETLALIFTLGTLTTFGQSDAAYDVTKFPILVSHVSRRWRAVALGTPRLWSTILVYRPFTLHNSTEGGGESSHTSRLTETTCLLQLQTFLERSKSSPLTLYFDIRSPSWFFCANEDDHPFTPHHMTVLLDYLLPHLDRWQDVEILCDTWAAFGVFLERCSRTEPRDVENRPKRLRRLALTRCNAYFALQGNRFAPERTKSFINPFKESPLLRDVELSGVHIDWSTPALSNLTSLSLMYHAKDVLPTANELISIINSSPNLECLSIHGWGVRSLDDEASALEDSITITNITKLSIGWVDAHYCLRLLSLFAWHLPKLQSVILEDVGNRLNPVAEQDSSCILDYIHTRLSQHRDTSSPPYGVIELTLNSVHASLHSLHRFMGRLPLLESLTLHNVDDALLYILQPWKSTSGDTSVICPRLSFIIVRTVGTVSPMELHRMVREREVNCTSVLGSSYPVSLEIEDLHTSDTETELPSEDVFDDDYDLVSYEGGTEAVFTGYSENFTMDSVDRKERFLCTPIPDIIQANYDDKLANSEDLHWPILGKEVGRGA